MAGEIATAYVSILPSLEGLKARLEAGFAGAGDIGQQTGEQIGAGLTTGLGAASARVEESLRASLEGGAAAGAAAGVQIGDGVARGAQEGAERASESIHEIGVAGREAGEEAGAGLSAFGENIRALAETFAEFFAIEKIAEFAKGSIEAGEDVERTTNLINAQIKATGDASHVTAAQIQSLATSVSNASGIARSQVLLSEQALLRFSNVANQPGAGNDIFTRASHDAADLAAVMHTSLPAAATILGKALDNPTVGLTRLTRVGVTFTAQQTAQIKALTNSGHLLQAQGIILNKFESDFGGAAAAAATPLDRLKASLSNLEADLGQALLPAIDAGLDGFVRLGIAASNAASGGLTRIGAAFDALEHHNDLDLAKALNVSGLSPVIGDLDRLRDTVTGAMSAIKADFAAVAPGAEAFGKTLAEAGVAAGGGFLTGIEGLARALEPVARGLSDVLKYASGFHGLFDGIAVGVLAGVAAFKAITLAVEGYEAVVKLAAAANSLLEASMVAADITELVNPIGLAAAGIGLLAAGVLALTGHFRAATPAVADYAAALEQSNGAISTNIRTLAAQTLQQDGALTAAGKLGISLGTVTSAALGNAGAFDQIKAKGQQLLTNYNQLVSSNDRLVASGKLTEAQAQARTDGAQAQIGVYNKLVSVIDANSGKLETQRAAYEQITAAVKQSTGATQLDSAQKAAASAAAKQLTGDQNALNAALKTQSADLSYLDTVLGNVVGKYFSVSASQDAFQSSLNQLSTSAKAAKKDFTGDSDAAIQYRSSAEAAAAAVAAITQKQIENHAPAATVLKDFQDNRAELVKSYEQMGLTTKQIGFLTGGLKGIPTLIATKYSTPGSDAAAKAAKLQHDLNSDIQTHVATALSTPGAAAAALALQLVAQRAKNVPPKADTAVYAQGTAEFERQMYAAASAVNAIPSSKTVTIHENVDPESGNDRSGQNKAQGLAIAHPLGAVADTAGASLTSAALTQVEQYVSGFRSLATALGPGLLGKLTGSSDTVKSTLESLSKSLSSAYFDADKEIAKLDAVKKKTTAQETELTDLRNLPSQTRLARILSVDSAALEQQVGKRDAIATELATAQQALTDAVSQKASDASGITSGIITGSSLIGSSNTAATAAVFATQLQQQANTASAFSQQIAALASKGLSKDVLSQLASGGVADEAQAALLSKATSAQIAAINHAQGVIDAAAAKTGQVAANYLDGATITADQATVKGLEVQEASANKKMTQIGTALQEALAESLGITGKNPKAATIGGQFIQAVVAGAQAKVASLNGSVAGQSTASVAKPVTAPKKAATGVVQNIHVVATDPKATAKAIVKAQKVQNVFSNLRAVRVL